MRKSKPGLSGSRRESIIGDSQSAQNGRSLEALPWKNEGTERLSMTRFLWLGGSATLSVTDGCRDGAVTGASCFNSELTGWSILLSHEKVLFCMGKVLLAIIAVAVAVLIAAFVCGLRVVPAPVPMFKSVQTAGAFL